MKTSDVVNALRFWHLKDTIVLLVARKDNIPYVRRELMKLLGEPRKMIGNVMYYYDNRIVIETVIRNGRYNYKDLANIRGNMYYIGWKDNKDLDVLSSAGIRILDKPVRSIELWKSLGMSMDAMYRALLVDGYDDISAAYILSICGVV